jgi:glucan 1,3-beta-glucosidase
MADLEIEGGKYGLNIGNQQFTLRNIKISKAQIGISQIWDWGWLYSGLDISDCKVAFSMINGYDVGKLQIGSVVIIDSKITNCPVFMDTVSRIRVAYRRYKAQVSLTILRPGNATLCLSVRVN